MRARSYGHRLALGLVLGLTAPSTVRGNEFTLTLGPHTQVPVGPAGTRYQIRRMVVQGVRYVTAAGPATSSTSRCGVPLQRVTVWEQQSDRTWLEALSDTYDTCTRTAGEQRQLSVSVVNGPEAHVLLQAPRTLPESATLVRYLRSGDRFIGPHRERPIAATPTEAPRGSLLEAPAGAVDGDVSEWHGREALVSVQTGRVWLGAAGRTLRFAAHVPRDVEPVLTLVLAPQGISTDLLHATVDNHGRFLTLRCDTAPPQDAEVRCRRGPEGTDMEGTTDLGTMVWDGPTVTTLTAYAQLGEGTARLASDPNFRLHPYTLPTPWEVLGGASAQAVAQCATSRFRTWVPPYAASGAAGLGVVACGDRCDAGDCTQHYLAEDLPRLTITRDGGVFCTAVTGPGSVDVHTCGTDGDPARLIGLFPLVGFTTVVALDRQIPHGDSAGRRAEVWAAISPSAAWRQLWQGTERLSTEPARLDFVSLHPRFCGEADRCEVADGITMAPPEPPGPVTAGIARLGLSAGLHPAPRF